MVSYNKWGTAGDTLAPTLFAIFINDLIVELNILKKGVDIHGDNVAALLYADDLVIIAESEKELQDMLHKLNEWCIKWSMQINPGKSKAMHFRRKRQKRSTFQFLIGDKEISFESEYKYLGVWINEFCDFSKTEKVLSESSGRALGKLIGKFKGVKNMGYNTFTRLYNSCVVPIMNYGVGIWGIYSKSQLSEAVQNRAIRSFLGVHKFSANLAINGDMGWENCTIRKKIEILRVWNRLVVMDEARLCKKTFNWEFDKGVNNWCTCVKDIFIECNLKQWYDRKALCDLNFIRLKLWENYQIIWKENLQNKPKLHLFRQIKSYYAVEKYVFDNINFSLRSCIAQLRFGTLPLTVETGRFTSIKRDDRVCPICDTNDVEDELHFLFTCPKFSDLRKNMFSKVLRYNNDFLNHSQIDQFQILCSFPLFLGKYISSTFTRRQDLLYLKV